MIKSFFFLHIHGLHWNFHTKPEGFFYLFNCSIPNLLKMVSFLFCPFWFLFILVFSPQGIEAELSVKELLDAKGIEEKRKSSADLSVSLPAEKLYFCFGKVIDFCLSS